MDWARDCLREAQIAILIDNLSRLAFLLFSSRSFIDSLNSIRCRWSLDTWLFYGALVVRNSLAIVKVSYWHLEIDSVFRVAHVQVLAGSMTLLISFNLLINVFEQLQISQFRRSMTVIQLILLFSSAIESATNRIGLQPLVKCLLAPIVVF